MEEYNPFLLAYYKKNDKNIKYNSYNNLNEMFPVYTTNEEFMCGVIDYNHKTYLLDFKDRDKIINFNKNFIFENIDDDYPSYCSNYKRHSYVDFIYNYNTEKCCYEFVNGNKYDIRSTNVKIYHSYHAQIKHTYNVVEYITGHYSTLGMHANMMKNPMWKINENGKEYLLMYCEKDAICKLCDRSYQKILDFEKASNGGKKITFFGHSNGYISSTINLSIHQIITGCYGNGKGTKNISVDHIDRNPLNNTWINLRIASQTEQQNNTKGIMSGTKRERKHNARGLPDGMSQDMLRKYVVYYEETYNKDQNKIRSFFKVEKHPKLDKPWATTKSTKVSIEDKLIQANKVIDDLENNIYPEKEELNLPKYVSLTFTREKPHLVYEKRADGNRLGLKMVLPIEYDLQEQISILNEKIGLKYTGESIL